MKAKTEGLTSACPYIVICGVLTKTMSLVDKGQFPVLIWVPTKDGVIGHTVGGQYLLLVLTDGYYLLQTFEERQL